MLPFHILHLGCLGWCSNAFMPERKHSQTLFRFPRCAKPLNIFHKAVVWGTVKASHYRPKGTKWQLALCYPSEKSDVKVNLWVTTGAGIEIGQRGLSVSVSASQILARHHLHCGSALTLWIFHDVHLTPCPERYFKVFCFPDRKPGVRECHRGVKSVCGPQAKDRIYDAALDDIKWIFSSVIEERLSCPLLKKHWASHSLLLLLERSVSVLLSIKTWFQYATGESCVLTKCDQFAASISVKPQWLSRGESGGLAVLNTAFSILHCPLALASP